MTALLLFIACAEPLALPVSYAGCADTAAGCELTFGEPLRLWVGGAAPEVFLDGEPVEAQAAAADGGVRVTWATPAAGTLTVRGEGATFTLRLVDPQVRTWEADLRAAAREGPGGACHERGRALLSEVSPADRGPLLWILAGCDLRVGDREAAAARMAEAAVALDAAGRVFDAARARCALSSVLFGAEGSLTEIRALLDAVPDRSANATLAWASAWHHALLHRRSGDYRAALAALRQAEAVAARVGLEPERGAALEQRAMVDAELGSFDAAVRTMRALVAVTPTDAGDCVARGRAAGRATTLAWFLLLRARDAARRPDPEAVTLLKGALEVHQACAHAAREVANVEVNLALAAWWSGDPDAARRHLAAAKPARDPLYGAWVAELEGNLALAEGRLDVAEDAFDRAVAAARLRGAPEGEAQALAGRAEVHEAAGRSEAALEDLEAAHTALWGAISFLPVDAGAATFLAARRSMTERYVELLLERGRDADALEVVRRARTHLLRAGHVRARIEALDPDGRRRWEAAVTRYRALRAAREAVAADAWTVSEAELAARRGDQRARDEEARRALDAAIASLGPADTAATPAPPRAGEVLVAWFPIRDSWVAFTATTAGVRVVRVGALPKEEEALGRALLSPLGDLLADAERVVVLPWGTLREVDVHALPLEGEPLLARVPVVYSLDLGVPPAPSPGPRLLLADPTGDLPGARAEAAIVRAAWPDARVLSGAQVRRDTVLEALAEAGAFHYAGHASFPEEDALSASLPLADGAVRVGDILALPRVPTEVVLSACESGRASAGGVETWGLAQAFVARGTATVLAASRPVSDRAGSTLAAALYAPGDVPLAEAARLAQMGLRNEGIEEWRAFRVWVP